MCLTFELVDKVLKEYGLESHPIGDGHRTEYAFAVRKSHTGKHNVATNVSPLMNGGVRGYLYVGYLKEFKFRQEATIGYPYIKTSEEHIKINDLSEEELRSYLDRITLYYS